MNIRELSVAYKSSSNDRYIYVFEDALTAFGQTITAKGALVPPCIMQTSNSTVQLLIGFEEDPTPLNTRPNGLVEEIIQSFQDYLEKRRSQLRLSRGFAPLQKLIVVEDAKADNIYKQLQAIIKSMQKEKDPNQ